MACQYTGATGVLLIVAFLARAPPAVLWILGALLLWFAKGLFAYRHETQGKWVHKPGPIRPWRDPETFDPGEVEQRLRRLYR